ncbi:zinc ribbon domain-containing protein [Natrinema ejinorense]|uniref:Zinc ribbon domain-containing protein n=1 Tax=Natrinema ejinorense TaxID=373386 RepID=A0A2A5QTW3_9EURY|nr:zinc ribbon domain-containing protein [Natrinema ejinorense]PCR90223.1 zinc ribbon domain-containing protein [Natrinema ejinorense]
MSLVLVGAVLLLCLLPSLFFLGLWHGLLRMQRSSLLSRTRTRAGNTDTDPAVTWGDIIDAYADPRKSLFTPPSESRPSTTRDGQCGVCAAGNDSFASFCHNCFRKLE